MTPGLQSRVPRLRAGRNREQCEAPLTAAVPSVGCADISPHSGESPSEQCNHISDRGVTGSSPVFTCNCLFYAL